MNKFKILLVFGTRPEAIKMAPLVDAIRKDDMFECVVCVTAQHREMLDQVLKVFDIIPNYDLNIMKESQTLSSLTSDIVREMDVILEKEQPNLVLVHGDTITSFVSALAAYYRKIKVGHVEAGLRSHNKYSPFPEELNRIMTGYIANLHFCPTEQNVINLLRENISENIYITGNTVIDALKSLIKNDYEFHNEELRNINLDNKKTIIMTIHRRENIGEPMENIFNAVKEIALQDDSVQFIYFIHKNPVVYTHAKKILSNVDNVFLLEPIEVDDLHNLINKSYMVFTDSGGLQEEAPALGKPVLVARTETERPEAVEMGTVKVVGIDKDNIIKEIKLLLNDEKEYEKMAKSVNPYGDGTAAEKIIKNIKNHFKI